MPRIEKFFANSQVKDWTGRTLAAAAGGVTTYGNGGEMNVYTDPADADQMYFAHKIKATGNFTVEEGDFDIDIVLIAGGGAGGGRVIDSIPVSSTGGPAGNGVYPIVIGAGGDGYDQAPSGNSDPGNDSTAFGYTANGGGTGAPNSGSGPTGGSPVYWSVGVPGGSGGGQVKNEWGWSPPAVYEQAGDGNDPAANGAQGNPGGNASGIYAPAARAIGQGSGGGAGGAGGTATSGQGPPGSPSPVFSYARGAQGGTHMSTTYFGGPASPEDYAGGGGGGQGQNWGSSSFPGGPPVWGGGGATGGGGTGGSAEQPGPFPTPTGGTVPNRGGYWPGDPTPNPGPDFQGFTYGHDGTANTGGGGGGAGPPGSGGGAGGSGVLLIRYKV